MACTRSLSAAPLIGVAMVTLAFTGCTSLNFPNLPIKTRSASDYRPIDGDDQWQGSVSKQAYHSVRQAKSQNSVVLQVVGDSNPVRVLPLPEGKSVYVSNLLTQTGVAKKLGSLEATVYRHSSDSINGLPMDVKMASDGQTVRPESDYALQAGDRLLVHKATNPLINELMSSLLGI